MIKEMRKGRSKREKRRNGEKESYAQREEMRFTFGTSFYGLISTSGHILIYGAGIRCLTLPRPNFAPVRLSRHFIGSTSRLVTRFVGSLIRSHRIVKRARRFQKKECISLIIFNNRSVAVLLTYLTHRSLLS